MLPLKHILYPIDFSDRSMAAAPFVEALADRYQAKVTLLSALQPVINPGMEDPSFFVDLTSLRSDLETRLAGTLATHFPRNTVERVAEIGEPAHSITRYAHDHQVDMIMMPSHGHGIFHRMLLGSVTAKVLHDAECPVWTSAHTEELPVGHPMPSKILCAVDLMASSAALVQWVAQLAADTGASLRLIHAIPGAAAWPERQFNAELEQALKDKARQEISVLLSASGLEFPICIGAGDVAAVVSEEARGHDADLVVIGRGVIHEKLGRLRTHAHAVIRQAPCPVISV